MKHLTLLIYSLPILLDATSQSAKPAPQQTVPELPKLLAGIGLPYQVANDSQAMIPYGGANLASFDVYIQKVADLYIVYSNLSESLPGKFWPTAYKYLLQQNERFDIVKIGISGEEDSVFLRADIHRMGITTSTLKRVIVQVANVTNIIAGEIK
jgi:hypothetical protein